MTLSCWGPGIWPPPEWPWWKRTWVKLKLWWRLRHFGKKITIPAFTKDISALRNVDLREILCSSSLKDPVYTKFTTAVEIGRLNENTDKQGTGSSSPGLCGTGTAGCDVHMSPDQLN